VYRGQAKLESIPKRALARLRANGVDGLVGFRLNKHDKLEHIGKFTIGSGEEKGKNKKKAQREVQAVAEVAAKSAKATKKVKRPVVVEEDEDEDSEDYE
jgi:hypothetical protein